MIGKRQVSPSTKGPRWSVVVLIVGAAAEAGPTRTNAAASARTAAGNLVISLSFV
jgi:hypothetical protein